MRAPFVCAGPVQRLPPEDPEPDDPLEEPDDPELPDEPELPDIPDEDEPDELALRAFSSLREELLLPPDVPELPL